MKTFREILDSVPSEVKRLVEIQGDIGIAISEAIESSGVTVKELGEKTGIHPSTLKIIIAGQRNLTLQTIARIETMLDVRMIHVTGEP